MPQVKKMSIGSGWFLNKAVDAQGRPRPLSLGTITFKAGQKRLVPEHLLLESRFTNDAFTRSLANGNLVAVSADEPKVAAVVEPKRIVLPVVEAPVAEETPVVETPVAEEAPPPVADFDGGGKRGRRRRHEDVE